MQLHTILSLLLAVVICGLAMWRGDPPARWSGATILASWIGSLLVYRGGHFNTDYGVLAIDVLTLVAITWISIRARRIWTLVAAAFMALIVASHVAVMIDLRVTIDTLWFSMAMWSYGVLACIAFGTWAGRRDARRAQGAESGS